MTILWCWRCRYSWVQFRTGNLMRPHRALCEHPKQRIGG
jgi:hypothetical protein